MASTPRCTASFSAPMVSGPAEWSSCSIRRVQASQTDGGERWRRVRDRRRSVCYRHGAGAVPMGHCCMPRTGGPDHSAHHLGGGTAGGPTSSRRSHCCRAGGGGGDLLGPPRGRGCPWRSGVGADEVGLGGWLMAGWSYPFGCLLLFVTACSVVHMYLCSGLTRELTFIFDPVLA